MVDGRMRKKGQFMALYLVMLTLVMCGIVIGSYIIHQERLSGSLVSPLVILETRDGLDVFEMREVELIMESLDKSGLDKDVFKNEFVSGINVDMMDFIFEDLFWEGNDMNKDFNKDAFLENVLYSVAEDSGNLVLKRAEIGKRILLRASDETKVNFPVDFYFDFSAEYLIRKVGSKFLVEKV